MVFTISQRHRNIDDRVTVRPFGQRFFYAMFDCWDVVSWNGATLHGLREREPSAKWLWRNLHDNVGELPRPAGLLSVTMMLLHAAPYCLAQGSGHFAAFHFDTEAVFQSFSKAA